jgi:ATP adenylyltransferase
MERDYFFSFEKLGYVKGEKPDGCILCMLTENDPRVVDLTIYRDDLFIVCLNLYPYNPGHLLVFPVRHLEDIRGYSSQEEQRLNLICRFFLDVLDDSHDAFAYNIGYNMGLTSGASINHLHLHIIPRYPHETGITDLIAGKRVLVEDPRESKKKILEIVRKDIKKSKLGKLTYELG